MQVFNTLIEAAQYVSKRRDRRQIWCIASLEGAQYYGLVSQPNLGGYSYNHATKMLAVNNELLNRQSSHNEIRERANRLAGYLHAEAIRRNVIQRDRHAEEVFIENWDDCVRSFIQLRHRKPKKVDLFLSHTPCTHGDNSPSPARILGSNFYPLSCTNKLKLFASKNPTIKLRVYYLNKFGVNEALNEQALKDFYLNNGLIINTMDPGVRMTCGSII
ncbi:hypothetical protein M9194_17600 [Vibrio sp. S4M6]|uniref:hypothetical protein n=1 Tax=Vibrio sinus TaxID=2946865 RepID=UPI00202A1D2A|nr:hypothetical protein [Vibrio sinus]MCL9783247.1 hypothetical protein [Vibrio sinus]